METKYVETEVSKLQLKEIQSQELVSQLKVREYEIEFRFMIEYEVESRFVGRVSNILSQDDFDTHENEFVHLVDNFQYHYIRYIYGKENSLRKVFDEIAKLLKNKYFYVYLLTYFMQYITSTLKRYEMHQELKLHTDSILVIWEKFGLPLHKLE